MWPLFSHFQPKEQFRSRFKKIHWGYTVVTLCFNRGLLETKSSLFIDRIYVIQYVWFYVTVVMSTICFTSSWSHDTISSCLFSREKEEMRQAASCSSYIPDHTSHHTLNYRMSKKCINFFVWKFQRLHFFPTRYWED